MECTEKVDHLMNSNQDLPPGTRSSLIYLYKDFSKTTTMHGVRRTMMKDECRRMIWAILLLSCIVWAVTQFVFIINNYYSYPVTTVVSLKQEDYLPFPAVTICNLNYIKRSSIPESVYQKEYTRILSNNSGFNHLIHLMNIMSAENPGHGLKLMIVDCQFNQENCTQDDFKALLSLNNGNCYTFNHDATKPLLVSEAGSTYGLVLELNVETYEYIYLADTMGIRLTIHNPSETPFHDDSGLVASPGETTYIALTQKRINRLPPPHGVCFKKSDIQFLTLPTFWDNKYSEGVCKKSCHQTAIFAACKCCDINLPCYEEDLSKRVKRPKHEYFFCNSTTDRSCVKNLLKNIKDIDKDCGSQCPPMCDQVSFLNDISTGHWPSEAYLDLFLDKVKKVLNDKKLPKTDQAAFVQKNFLRLEVYYDSLNVEENTMKPLYDWSKLLSDIGGHLGLCLGFSILTGIELIELLVNMMVVCSKTLLCRRAPRDGIVDVEKSVGSTGTVSMQKAIDEFNDVKKSTRTIYSEETENKYIVTEKSSKL